MNFSRGFLAARPHLTFLVGMGSAVGLAWHLESGAMQHEPEGIGSVSVIDTLALSETLPTRATGVSLSEDEVAQARVAWRYFENNYNEKTGFVNSADKYPSTTLWDLGSYAMGLLAVEDLGIISPEVFDARMGKLLDSLMALPLVEDKLPNKVYHTRTLEMVDYSNDVVEGGIGWSTIDVARLAVPLNITLWRHPRYTEKVRAVLQKWSLTEAVADGELQGGARDLSTGEVQLVQEGRFGYEEYAAKSMFLLGSDVDVAIQYTHQVAMTEVSGQPILYDARDPADHGGTHNAVVSEPYILEAIEYGLTSVTQPIATAVYLAQRNRYQTTGVLTAVSEDNINRPPHFVYNSVYNDGEHWAAFAPNGDPADEHRAVSLKAARGWAALFDDSYAATLRSAVSELYDPDRGWYSGIYEADGETNTILTANTNGIVLELLWYRVRGPLLPAARRP